MTQSGVARWTNPSVLRFAADGDPVRRMEERIRDIVLRARDAGWNGPPFNPVTLAKFLNISVDPTTSVVDARTVPVTGGVRIQYNPQQPRERARFSIAHEIAHTLFDDVGNSTRHRGGDPAVSDDWQLEMLCNIAAAEIVMPVGSLPSRTEMPPIEELLRERLKYDVSIEAYLMRATKAARNPTSMFVASPRSGRGGISYSIDYAVSSPTAPQLKLRGMKIPSESSVLFCPAIGATSHGSEDWLTGENARLESVGIPGYPGSSYPRIAVLVRHAHSDTPEVLHYLQGNVLEPRPFPPVVICQLTNDRATRWGGGVAKQAARKYPAAEDEYSEWVKSVPRADRLGEVHYSQVDSGPIIATIIAQEGLGASDAPRIRYRALDQGLYQLGQYAKMIDASVHMPRIGTGAAGGDWVVIEAMIRSHFAGLRQGIWIYDPPPKSSQLDLLGL